jgi:MFS family permease
VSARVEAEREAKALPARRPVAWATAVVVFFLLNVLTWADRTNFSVAAVVWARQFHWGPTVIGAMLSAFTLGYLVMQPFGGILSDRLGPRRTVAGTTLGWSVFVLLTPLAPAVLWLTGAFRALLGICEAPYIPACTAGVARAVPQENLRGRYNSFIQSGAQLGPAAGTFFAALILKATGAPANIFLIFGGVGIVAVAAWWLYASRRDDPAPEGEAGTSDEARERAEAAPVPLGRMLSSGTVWALLLGYFALPYCQYLFLTWLPEYLTKYRHIHLIEAGFLSSLPFLVAFVGANVCGFLMDWFGMLGWRGGYLHRKIFIWIGALTYVVTVLVAANTPSASLAVTMIVIADVGLAFYVYPFWTLVTDMAPRQAGTLSGCMNFCGIAGALISPILAGVMVQATGAFVLPLDVAAGVMAAAALVTVLFLKVKPLDQLVGTRSGSPS